MRDKKKMSESDDERDSSYKTTKIPKFSGEEDDWDIWMTQFIAILGNKGLARLLTYEGEIPTDDETFTAVTGDSEDTKRTKKQRKKLRDANSNAFSLLIQAFDTSNPKGRTAFYNVKSAMSPITGYRYGHFKNAWDELLNTYESTETPVLQDEVTKYYKSEMEDDEDPEEFIIKMCIMREKLHNLGWTIPEDRFMRDLIAKLPRSKVDGNLSQYEMKGDELLKRIEDPGDFLTVRDMKRVLKLLYTRLFRDRLARNSSEGRDEKALTSFQGQFKKKCFKCGDWGHPAKFCPNKEQSTTGSASRDSKLSRGGEKKEDRKCHHCGKVGHIKANCWSLHGGPKSNGRSSAAGSRGSGNRGNRETANLTYEVVLQATDVDEGWTSVLPSPVSYDAIETICTDDFVQEEELEAISLEAEAMDPEWYDNEVETAMVATEDWWETHQAYVASTKAWKEPHGETLLKTSGEPKGLYLLESDLVEATFRKSQPEHAGLVTANIDSQDKEAWHLVRFSKYRANRVRNTGQSKEKRWNQACMKIQAGSPEEKHVPDLTSHHKKEVMKLEDKKTQEDGELQVLPVPSQAHGNPCEEAHQDPHDRGHGAGEIGLALREEQTSDRLKETGAIGRETPVSHHHVLCPSHKVLFLGDSGASMHMGGSSHGLYDDRPCDIQIVVGNGKSMKAVRVGKLPVEFEMNDGTKMMVTLEDYHYVPEMGDMFLFSILNALHRGWHLANEKMVMTLTRGSTMLKFDHLLKTPKGVLGALKGILIGPCERAYPSMMGSGDWSMDTNRFHKVFGHVHEATGKLTARYYSVETTGTIQPCEDCNLSKARQKNVAKSTMTMATTPGERLFLDISSVAHKSFGGSKFWILVLDDKTDMIWSIFVQHKNQLAKEVDTLLDVLSSQGKTVRYIRGDNAGENKMLEQLCIKKKRGIEFEYTPRDSPQYNGKVERKFATLWNRVRSDLNAAKLSKDLRHGIWTECAKHATDVENIIVTPKKSQAGPSYMQFYGRDWKGVKHLHQFGEMAVIKTGMKSQGKLRNKGTTMMYCGRANNHGEDVHRFLNLKTNRIIITRDVQWLKQVYGDWKGLTRANETISENVEVRIDHHMEDKDMEGDHDDSEEEDAPVPPAQAPPPPAPPRMAAKPINVKDARTPVRRELKKLSSGPEAPRIYGDLSTRTTRRSIRVADTVEEGEEPKEDSTQEEAKDEDLNTEGSNDLESVASEGTEHEEGHVVFEVCTEYGLQTRPTAMREEDLEKMDPSRYKDVFDNPRTFQDAWNHPCPFQRRLWREAMILKELKKMEELRVWKKIKRSAIPRNRRCVKHKWVLEIKRDGRFRARLVACGYSQVGGVDFTEVYSPVVNDTTFRIWLLWSLLKKKTRLVIDIHVAFLNGDLEEEIFMDCPQGLEHEEDECVLLKRTIYGLVQSARMYNLKFRDILLKIGYKQCECEPCLFYRKNELGMAILVSYVDDNAIAGDEAAIKDTLQGLMDNGLTYTRESLTDYLSCEVIFDKQETKAWIGQPHMMKKLKREFWKEVETLQVYDTPGSPNQGLMKLQEGEIGVDEEKHSRYRTGVGMLLYLMKTRPDLGNAIRELTKCLSGPSPAAYKEMLRVIKFAIDTHDYGLKMHPTSYDEMEWKLVLYSDSDWAGDKNDRKSISGHILYVNGVPVSWSSRGQKTVALSSAEAEYVAASEAVKEVLFVIQVLEFLQIKVKTPVTVHVDNMGAIFMLENRTSNKRTRHVDVRYRFVTDLIEKKIIEVVFVPTKRNYSDAQTKNITKDIYQAHTPQYVEKRSYVDGEEG